MTDKSLAELFEELNDLTSNFISQCDNMFKKEGNYQDFTTKEALQNSQMGSVIL